MSDLLQHQPETRYPRQPLLGRSRYRESQVRAALALLRLGWSPHWVADALAIRDLEARQWLEVLLMEGGP